MPRVINPGSIRVGSGKTGADKSVPRAALSGSGLVGAGPNIGEGVPFDTATSAHVSSHSAAHEASAIRTDGNPDLLWSRDVEGSLDELSGTIMKRPPMLGEWSRDTTYTGIPDWGFLKLRDGSLDNYPGASETGAEDLEINESIYAADVYPYLLQTIGPAIDTEFNVKGSDPATDWLFNTGLETLGTVKGAGYGRTHIGAFTRDGDVGPDPLPIFRTARLLSRPTGNDAETGVPERIPVTVSGTVFPADRGVLALLHFMPIEGDDAQATFLAQPLISDHTDPLSPQGRVVAAILLGGGILGDKCAGGDDCSDSRSCDGQPGGIFSKGFDSNGKYDPFSFPGQATGQYHLGEIHNGVNFDGDPLKSPFDDMDSDSFAGVSRAELAVIPAAGQVRLGTDPSAGEDQVGYGIPILGGTDEWYDSAPTAQDGSLGLQIHGDAVVEASNFFGFRLPVLKDYSQDTGLKWTPRGEEILDSLETSRFFVKPTGTADTYSDGEDVGSSLRTAGAYDGFDEDYWPWQIARYRQTFFLPSTEDDGDREEVGSYLLVHFKTEADFERCVRDGEFPWDAADPYEVYGVSLLTSSTQEEVSNVANHWLEATPPSPPHGPAPAYGYAADAYHVVRGSIFLDPVGQDLPAVTDSAFDWSSTSSPGDEDVTWISGVAYFVPRQVDTGDAAFEITQLSISLDAGFWTSYRTASKDYASGVGPADVASQNPVFFAIAPWAYASSSLSVPVDPDPSLGAVPDTSYVTRYALEVPFTHLGGNGSGPFDEDNAPLDADTLDFVLPDSIELLGDTREAMFSRDAVVRAHFRRPLAHISPNTTSLPFDATDGHGELLTHDTPGVVLMHTTRFDATAKNGDYGNFVEDAVGTPPNTGYPELHGSPKDAVEVFLDEVARISPEFPAGIDGTGPYTADTVACLEGPGMGGWTGGPVEIPVRVSLATAPWNECSWLLNEQHLLDLTSVGVGAESLQVAGLPDRNPPIVAGATMPFPPCGMLLYPQHDFSSGYFPETGTHITDAQPDYSGATGVRSYIRAFDAAFSHTGSLSFDPSGQTEFTLRVDGVTLADLAYTAPGPGGLASDRIAVEVKVPGLTTWMDAGRSDGSGPSKQDPSLDGAGCMIVGDGTYDFIDPETGYRGCYIRVHVGPTATLFINPADYSGYTSDSPEGECPVLVRVRMDAGAVAYNLEEEATGVGTFMGTSAPGAAPADVRGIIGISIVHPDAELVEA